MNIISIIYIVIAGLSWGTSGIFVHYLTPYGVTSAQMTLIRGFVSVLVLGVYILISKKNFKNKKRDLPLMLGSGLFMMLTSVFYFTSMQKTSVATSVTLMYMAPIYVTCYACIFLREKLSVSKIIAVILVVLGCAFTSGIVGGLKYDLLGIIFGILSGLSYGSYSIFVKIMHRRGINVLFSLFYSYLVMSLSSMIIASPIDVIIMGSRSYVLTLLMIGLGFFTFTLPYFLYSVGMKKLPASVASGLAVIEPLSATLYSVLLFNEKLGLFNIIGLLSIVIGVVLLSKAK